MNKKLSFACDYAKGAHPAIMRRMVETNLMETAGYGLDEISDSARNRIRKACKCENAAVEFLTGGTQTNAVMIDALLKSYQGVIAARTGHISVHEAGAIEANGHKVLTIPHQYGKISAVDVEKYLEDFYSDENHEHMVMPGMVYLSHPTEYGTLYAKAELQAFRNVCDKYGIYLYVDGARLAYGLAGDGCDLTIKDLAERCDVFYLGGTKVGALCGEAVVFPRGNAPAHFMTMVKQHGALLAKGRLLGIQFDVLMQDGLYFKIARHAVEQAIRLRDAFVAKGYKMYSNSPTNQQFVLLDKCTIERLEKDFVFEQWFPVGNMMNCRFVTSWATRSEDVDALIAAL